MVWRDEYFVLEEYNIVVAAIYVTHFFANNYFNIYRMGKNITMMRESPWAFDCYSGEREILWCEAESLPTHFSFLGVERNMW
jgi:hypothetical protein